MKLVDLHPRWIGCGGEGVTDKDGNPVPYRANIGLICDCPVCGPDHELFVPFANPVDGKGPHDSRQGWQRVGETFDDLTLTPSILRKDRCGWHGFITNGEIITC